VGAGRDLVREGDHPTECQLILQGFAYRHRMLENGQRQIMSFEIPGDLCDLHGFLLGKADHSVATLTPCRVATLPREVLTDWVERRPAVARALWRGTLVDAAVSQTWLLNIGRRTARERIAHLLCEVVLRLEAVGFAEDGGCTLPIMQTEIADALGLSVVHVNRALQSLGGEELVTSEGGQVTIDDLRGLQVAGGFDPAYLHLHGDVAGRARGRAPGARTRRPHLVPDRAGDGSAVQTQDIRGRP
jgi:CRP-like cAMP-binding protein